MNAPPRKLPVPLVLVLGVFAERAGWIPDCAAFGEAKPLASCATHLGSPTGNV